MDAVKRAIRTFFQTFLGAVITSGAFSAVSETGVVDWSALKKVVVAGCVAGFCAVVTYVWNWLETATGKDLLPK